MVGSCNQLTETHNAFLKGDIFGISSNALVSKSLCNYLIGPIDVAKVDDDRAGYLALEAGQIERAKLLPLGHDHQRVRAFGAVLNKSLEVRFENQNRPTVRLFVVLWNRRATAPPAGPALQAYQ